MAIICNFTCFNNQVNEAKGLESLHNFAEHGSRQVTSFPILIEFCWLFGHLVFYFLHFDVSFSIICSLSKLWRFGFHGIQNDFTAVLDCVDQNFVSVLCFQFQKQRNHNHNFKFPKSFKHFNSIRISHLVICTCNMPQIDHQQFTFSSLVQIHFSAHFNSSLSNL